MKHLIFICQRISRLECALYRHTFSFSASVSGFCLSRLPKMLPIISKTASTIRLMPINIHKTAVVLKGFVMTIMPQKTEIAALIAIQNHLLRFIRIISTVHCSFAMPVIRITTPYTSVSTGKVAINQWELKAQKAPPPS